MKEGTENRGAIESVMRIVRKSVGFCSLFSTIRCPAHTSISPVFVT